MKKAAVAGNQATGLLKLLALLFMCCDHAGKMLAPGVLEWRMLGRLALPLYAWCLVVGACYTRSMGKYLLRMVAVGAISQPLYMWALNHSWQELNIFFTLALALVGVWCIREKRWLSQWWGPVAVLLISATLRVDYGWKGVLFILLLYGVRESRAAIACMMVAFCLFWGSSSATVPSILGVRVPITGMIGLVTLMSPWLRLQAMAIGALPLILWRCPWRISLPSWVGYGFYPVHLLILGFIESVIK